MASPAAHCRFPSGTARFGTPLPVYCLPFAGAGSMCYRVWLAMLPGELELIGCVLPGRDHRFREPPLRRMKELVTRLGPDLASATSEAYALFGHSMGALIAFELARWLRATGCPPPTVLIVSGCPAPHMPSRAAHAYLLSDPKFSEFIRRLGGTPGAVLDDPRSQAHLVALMKADFELTATYEYQAEEPLDCPIVALRGAEDNWAPRGDVRAWMSHTVGEFRFAEVTGGHFVAVEAPESFVDLLMGSTAGILHHPAATG